MRRALALSTLLLLCACGVTRTVTGLSPVTEGATHQKVFIATLRGEDQLGQMFGQNRNPVLRFGLIDVPVPPGHQTGRLEWSSNNPDPTGEFAVTALQEFATIAQFRTAVDQLQTEFPNEIVVFVHGYNTTGAEAVFRVAQIQEDFRLDDPMVLFAWPSAGRATGYAYDRDSVLFARDDLTQLLTDLTQGDRRIVIVGHSMGTHLVMESMRQLRLQGHHLAIDHIQGVILMSPDIDTDLFHRQADAIAPLPQPFLVFAAQQDQALNISSLLTGFRPRLGRIVDQETLGRDDVRVIDVSDFATGHEFNHLVPVTSPGAISFLRRLGNLDRSSSDAFSDFISQPARSQ